MADRIFLGNLFIRADAGGSIGTGHVMRMLALAQAYQRCGGLVSFICTQLPTALEDRLIEEGCKVIWISGESGSAEDARETLDIVREPVGSRQEALDCQQELGREKSLSQFSGNGFSDPTDQRLLASGKWLVVDGYQFGYDYQKQIKDSGISLLCVDDFCYSERWCCDAILNHNLDAERQFDYTNDISSYQRLLGASFCLLREEFLEAEINRKPWRRIHRLLITLGGSDQDNATSATLSLLNKSMICPLEIRVLAGADNPRADNLRAFQSHHDIEVIQNVTNMPDQYAWADGVISAGGSTCWEWLYWGLPGAVVTIAENQKPIVNALTTTRRAALSLGWVHEFDEGRPGSDLASWVDDPEIQIDRNLVNAVIDGCGADRVCEVLRYQILNS